MPKTKNGITLIALVITIIVLLILAGVTINMVLGDNGLFNKAKTAVGKHENAQEKENIALVGYENEVNGYINGNRDTVTLTTEQYNELTNRTKLINITAPNTSGWKKVADYPEGYNINNCSVSAARVYSELWGAWYVAPGATSTSWAVNFQMRDDGIYLYLWGDAVDGFKNQNGIVVLTKF